MITAEPGVLFDLALEHGRCVGLSIGAEGVDARLAARLHADEAALAATWSEARRRSWTAGRAALRVALDREGLDAPPVLTNERGAPVLPPGISASVSHKEIVAVALAMRGDTARVGVDVELDEPGRIDVARKVLTTGEQAEVARLEGDARGREVRLRFSAKEAVYKALDPFVRRYVGFHEVTVRPRADGTAEVHLQLAHEGPPEGPFDVEVRWLRRDGLVVTTARVASVPAV